MLIVTTMDDIHNQNVIFIVTFMIGFVFSAWCETCCLQTWMNTLVKSAPVIPTY